MNTTVAENDAERESSATSGPGRRLRTLRESSDLDIARVSVLLHLSEEMLTALEADDYAKLPGPVFIQGYLRNYARLLGVPVEPVLKAYRAASPESSRVPELRITQVSHEVGSGHALVRLATWGIVIGLILLSVVWWRGYLQWPMQVPGGTQSDTATLAEPAKSEGEESDSVQGFPVVEVNEEGEVTLGLPQGVPEPSPEEVTQASNGEGGTAPVAQESKPAAAANTLPDTQLESVEMAAGSGEPSAQDVGQVVLEFSGASWTKIEDASGSFKLEGSNNAGTRQVLKGVPPYRMVLGNASAVKIFVNGREFDVTPYSRGNVARLTLDPEKQSQ